jgi:hypothetical protein
VLSALLMAAITLWFWTSLRPARPRARAKLDAKLNQKLEKKLERARLRATASSEMYVDAQCCSSCGIPWNVAPDLFEERNQACFVRRQPRTVPELRRALRVFMTQDLGCVRYRGTDRRVVALLTKVGCRTHCDEPDDQRALPMAAASSTAVRPASSSST